MYEIVIIERGEAAYACAELIGEQLPQMREFLGGELPADAGEQRVAHRHVLVDQDQGTAGSWICPVAPDRRYNCRTMESCSCA